MKVLAIIPARGDSKRVPRKNAKPILGKPLLLYSVEAALGSKRVDRVVVSTDDNELEAISRKAGADVVVRPKSLAGDTATSESALVHVLDELKKKENYEPDVLVFLQCTSPVREKDDIDNAIQFFEKNKLDSLFSACRNDKFIWRADPTGPVSLNYDYKNRKREQDVPLEYRENGSIYVFYPKILREQNNRLGGKIGVYEMDFWNSFQVDSVEDLELIEWILAKRSKNTKK